MNYHNGEVGKFIVENSIPFHEYPALIDKLQEVEFLVPGWCHHVRVQYDLNLEQNSAAQVSTWYEYRRATIYLGPKYFAETDNQLYVLVHEVCHIIHEPLWNTATDMRNRVTDFEPNAKDFLQELCRHARESTVCDMAHIFLAMMQRGNNGALTPFPSTIANNGG